ncbi:universal stress protein [Limnobacter parvus]|uniref:Universal stress protein n=1 Tax=Limnobacter parvus TaxID=2939690 RepID=A0ABT1XKP2_9BURK|nr:universal stress protein [Limnobacter parvus]MCR2747866.1 universal stress protein [Limnobacter parvus]
MDERKIVACVDRSQYSIAVADCASWVARQIKAPVEFLHVIDRHLEQAEGEDHSGAIGFGAQENLMNKLVMSDSEKTKLAKTQGRLFLNGLRERAIEDGVAQADSRIRHGTLVDCLLEMQNDTRIAIIGRRGETSLASNRDIGRTFEAAVRAIDVPVLGVHEQFKVPERFLFAFDGSAVSKRGVQTVLQSKLFKGLKGTLLMCGEKTAGGTKLLEEAAQTLTDSGIPTEFSHVQGDVVTQMLNGLEIHQADMLAMGAYTHSPLRKLFFGSKTEDMLRATKVPALLLR